MRVLLWLVMLAAVLWGGWWWFGARTLEREAAGFFAAQEAAGRVARYEAVAVQGFPNRLDLTVTEPLLYDPWSGWGWRSTPPRGRIATGWRSGCAGAPRTTPSRNCGNGS